MIILDWVVFSHVAVAYKLAQAFESVLNELLKKKLWLGLFTMLYKVVLSLGSLDETFKCQVIQTKATCKSHLGGTVEPLLTLSFLSVRFPKCQRCS